MTRKKHLQIFRTNFYNCVFDPHFIIKVGESVDDFLMQTRLLFVRSASLSKLDYTSLQLAWSRRAWWGSEHGTSPCTASSFL